VTAASSARKFGVHTPGRSRGLLSSSVKAPLAHNADASNFGDDGSHVEPTGTQSSEHWVRVFGIPPDGGPTVVHAMGAACGPVLCFAAGSSSNSVLVCFESASAAASALAFDGSEALVEGWCIGVRAAAAPPPLTSVSSYSDHESVHPRRKMQVRVPCCMQREAPPRAAAASNAAPWASPFGSAASALQRGGGLLRSARTGAAAAASAAKSVTFAATADDEFPGTSGIDNSSGGGLFARSRGVFGRQQGPAEGVATTPSSSGAPPAAGAASSPAGAPGAGGSGVRAMFSSLFGGGTTPEGPSGGEARATPADHGAGSALAALPPTPATSSGPSAAGTSLQPASVFARSQYAWTEPGHHVTEPSVRPVSETVASSGAPDNTPRVRPGAAFTPSSVGFRAHHSDGGPQRGVNHADTGTPGARKHRWNGVEAAVARTPAGEARSIFRQPAPRSRNWCQRVCQLLWWY
jgi:hypothetical protein